MSQQHEIKVPKPPAGMLAASTDTHTSTNTSTNTRTNASENINTLLYGGRFNRPNGD